MRNVRAELESRLSKGRWGCPVKSQALGTAAVGRWGGAAGIQPPELWERPGVPEKGEFCAVMARGRGGRKAQEAALSAFSAKPGPVFLAS